MGESFVLVDELCVHSSETPDEERFWGPELPSRKELSMPEEK
jgi:hypothetical protein